MNHTFKLVLATSLVALFSNTLKSQNLEIVRGKTDTVYTTPHIVVGVTQPENTPSIHGSKVHIYKTAAFGSEVKLKPRNNVIKVSVQDSKGKKVAEDINVYYSTEPNLKALKETKQREEQAKIDSKITPVSFIVTTKKDA